MPYMGTVLPVEEDALYEYSSSGRGRWRRAGATTGRHPSGNTEARDVRLNPTNNDGHICHCYRLVKSK